MSNRFYEYDKGSSRSARDDSRHKERGDRARDDKKRRTRSRSPNTNHDSRSRHSSDYEKSKSYESERDYKERSSRRRPRNSDSESDEEVPAPPPPPRISKISIGFAKPTAPIKMNIGSAKVEKKAVAKPTVASVFNEDDDEDEPEEMPAEARMRMRNIGRETPTSAGPNSFGKTKQGFCDAKKVFEKNLKQALETEQKPPLPKFPQTIYKIKPS